MKILGISGSIRRASYNTLLLQAAAGFLEEQNASLNIHSLADVPLYNTDNDGEGKPAAVTALIDAIGKADGLLLSTPEYNYSVSGVLKNAIDWASRPAFQSVLAHKPTAILSASMSPLGGARAQVHLRDILAGTLTPIVMAPDYLLPLAQNAFDGEGKLSDEQASSRLQRFIADYLSWLTSRQ